MKTATAHIRYEISWRWFSGNFSVGVIERPIYEVNFIGYRTRHTLKTAMERTAKKLGLRLKWEE